MKKIETKTSVWELDNKPSAFTQLLKQIQSSADYDNTGRGYSIFVTLTNEDGSASTKTVRSWLKWLQKDKNVAGLFGAFDTWKDTYQPALSPDAEAAYDGTLHDFWGAKQTKQRILQWEQDKPTQVWTLVEIDGKNHIVAGFKRVNRIGYFLTQKRAPENFEALNVSEQ